MKRKQAIKKTVSKTASDNVAKSAAPTKEGSATLIVKAISILGYIGAGFGILFGLLLLFGGSFILGMLPLEEMSQVFGALAGAFIVILAVIMMAFSIFWIFVSKGLWAHKNWARIVFIVFSAIGLLNSIIMLPSSIVSLLIDGAIIYFLGFYENVKLLFK